jgi:hypothetical protein
MQKRYEETFKLNVAPVSCFGAHGSNPGPRLDNPGEDPYFYVANIDEVP